MPCESCQVVAVCHKNISLAYKNIKQVLDI